MYIEPGVFPLPAFFPTGAEVRNTPGDFYRKNDAADEAASDSDRSRNYTAVTNIDIKIKANIMIPSCLPLLMLILSWSLQPTIDTRYEKAVQYIQSDKEILAAVHETLPQRFQADTSIVFTVADSLIRPLLSTNLVIALKYGIMRSDTLVYDSLLNIERKKLYQYGQLYSQPMKLPELGRLSMQGNPNTVLFFSRPYENLLRVLILPVKIEFIGEFIDSQEQGEKEQSPVEEIPVINTNFTRMSSFNRGINISLLFDEKDSIKAVRFSSIVFD